MRISIIGTGAIGGYYGMLLAEMGHDLHFLLNSDYDYVKANGLKLHSQIHEDIYLSTVNAYKDASDMPVSDVVLVCLKTNQNGGVLPKVIPHVADENTVVILIQNGLGMEEELSKYFPELQIGGATALIGSRKEKNGIIIHESYGNIDFGSYSVKNVSVLDRLVADFNTINVPSSRKDLLYLRWKKLVWNMTFNGLSVLLGTTTDQIINRHILLCKTIMYEVIRAANACGVEIPISFADELILFTAKMDCYSPSMKVDFDRAQPLELEYMYKRPIITADIAGYEMTEIKNLYNELCKIQNLQNRN